MIRINEEICVGCGMCAADCVSHNIVIKENVATAKRDCFSCGHCVAICPVNAVSIPEYDMGDVEEYDPETFDLDPTNYLHAIKFRRSIRFFKDEKVAKDDLVQLIEAGRYTATAKNMQDCSFAVVQDARGELVEMVYGQIEEMERREGLKLAKELVPYAAFNRKRKTEGGEDFLFRNAPVVLFITSDWPLDAGLAAQNVENMAIAMGMGALYNGYLARFVNANEDIKAWLGLEGKEIRACMLLGYPDRIYARTAPRKEANVIWK